MNRPRLVECRCCGGGPAWTDEKLVWCDECLEVYAFVQATGYVLPRVIRSEVLAEEALRISGEWLRKQLRARPPARQGRLEF